MRTRGQCGLGEVSSLSKEGELPDPHQALFLSISGLEAGMGSPGCLVWLEPPPGAAFPHKKPTPYFYPPVTPVLGTK